jgi:hypothetical protein
VWARQGCFFFAVYRDDLPPSARRAAEPDRGER